MVSAMVREGQGMSGGEDNAQSVQDTENKLAVTASHASLFSSSQTLGQRAIAGAKTANTETPARMMAGCVPLWDDCYVAIKTTFYAPVKQL